MSKMPELTIMLSELDTLIKPEEERLVLDFARQAEDAGYGGIHIIDHVVMGPSSCYNGPPDNPRALRWVGNQAPDQHMPSQIVMMSAIAAVTQTIRLNATATLAPLRHPLLNAKQWATLDLISGGRVTILPIGGWQAEEYEAFGIPHKERGRRLDEQLEIMRLVWTETPASYHGEFYEFDDIYVMPKPIQPGGPEILIGGDRLTDKVISRIVKYGSGYTVLEPPSPERLAVLEEEMKKAGRSVSEFPTGGMLIALFDDPTQCANLERSIETFAAPLVERGVDRITLKPSQFIDDPKEMPAFLKKVYRMIEELV
ncbi:MAG: F420-dependent oxidoreductase [Deltaproteobacteria bacterium]|nr:F420-dependent oxidoreductase [Deltaproteobacteria bacterium]